MTPTRETTKKKHQDVVEAYYEEGLSYLVLAQKTGLSESSIKKIIAADRLANGCRERKKSPDDPRILGNQKAIAYELFCLGLHVGRYIADNELTNTSFGELGNLSMSRVTVGKILHGIYDVPFTKMRALEEVLGMSQDQLIRPPQKAKETNDH